MYQLIFRNWKFALLWAIGLTASAAAFLERGGGHEQLEASARQIRAQHEQTAAAPAPPVPQATERLDPLPEDAVSDEGDGPPEAEAVNDQAEAPDEASPAYTNLH